MADKTPCDFIKKKHVQFLLRCLDVLPQIHATFDTSRLAIAFFAISGLDMLNSLDILSDLRKQEIIDWIYSFQMYRNNSIWFVQNISADSAAIDSGHIAMTYTGLASLLVLGDDLSRVNKRGIIAGLKALQLPDGSFCATVEGSENDMRFVFCACAISYILQDWSGIDENKATEYIKNSMGYEFGIGQGPGFESHGGSTYCAIAALWLMNSLETAFSSRQISLLKRWCLHRQKLGFQGRTNKPDDTCYAFWIGAVLKMLGIIGMVDFVECREYVLSTQGLISGGLAKWPDASADPIHTYLGICGLALMGEEGLRKSFPALNISDKAAKHLHNIHKTWKNNKKNKNSTFYTIKLLRFYH
uniref:Geranylgeranyl transferase type-1 subunit beta n=1 Tax=Strigamia maritima TaxID=126957 RepID=T1J3U5_STRMM